MVGNFKKDIMKLRNILWGILTVVLITGCDSNVDDNMPDPQIYLSRDGIVDAKIYKTDEIVDYTVFFNQSGLFTENMSAELKLSMRALEELNENNGTSYKVLPAEVYNLSKSKVELAKDEKVGGFVIDFDIKKLEAISDLDEYCIPVEMISEYPSTMNKNKVRALLCPKLLEPLIYIKSAGIVQDNMKLGETDKLEFLVEVCTDFKTKHDVDLKFEFDPTALTKYNEENKTIFIPAPEGSFKIEGEEILHKGTYRAPFKLIVDKSMITENQIYTVPLILSSSSHYKIDEKRNVNFVRLSQTIEDKIEMERGMWREVYTSSWPGNATAPSTARNMLDGNYTTNWEAFWGTIPNPPASHQNKDFPFIIIWDLDEVVDMCGVEIWRRDHDTYAKDTRAGYIEVSKDNVNWYRATTFDFSGDDNKRGPFYLPFEDFEGQYVKIAITESERQTNVSIAEFFVYKR